MSASISLLAEGTRQKVERWRANLREAGIEHTVTSTRRSRQEQQQLFDKFQKGLSDLPAARPGTSMHELGRAVDVVFESEDDLLDAADLAVEAGLDWAGENDPVHFEDPEEPAEPVQRASFLSRKAPASFERVVQFIPGVSLVSELVSLLGIGDCKTCGR